jgi:hypothetical protein
MPANSKQKSQAKQLEELRNKLAHKNRLLAEKDTLIGMPPHYVLRPYS